LSREITGKMYDKNYRNAYKNLECKKEVENKYIKTYPQPI
jgi:hypothetical protein